MISPLTLDGSFDLPSELTAMAIQFSAWIETRSEPLSPVLKNVGGLPDERWRLFCLRIPELITSDTTRTLAERSHALLSRDPRAAVVLSQVATRIFEELEVTDEALMELGGDLWRHHAAALLATEDHRKCLDACLESGFYYDLLQGDRPGNAIRGLIEGQALHAVGQSKEGLAMIERATNLLLGFWDLKKKYVEGRTIYAKILIELGRHREALTVYEDSADRAQELGDTETLAYILNNVGHCAVAVGDLGHAERCFELALTMFENLHLTAELPRARGGLVLILTHRGRYNEAISELYKIRSNFLTLGMPVVAAQVGLDIVQNLLLAKRSADVPDLCNEMIATFEAAGLHRNALKALAYLGEVAANRSLEARDLNHVKNFLESLEDNIADYSFVAPEA